MGYATFCSRCGLCLDPALIAAHANAIAALKRKVSKTGVTFSAARPMTDELVDKLAIRSRAEKGV